MEQAILTIATKNCQLLVFRDVNYSQLAAEELEHLALKLRVPVEICSENIVDTEVLAKLVRGLGNQSDQQQRQILLLCGVYLEEQISVANRYMLAIGFDVYLIRDLIVPRVAVNAHIHDQRLSQAGAVTTTMPQIWYEWFVTEADQAPREILLNYKSI